MTTAKYFSGTEEIAQWDCISNAEFAALFPGIVGRRYDGFKKLVGNNAAGALRPITRTIFYKSNPSLHKCDARCTHAKGKNCECSCGGQFHGSQS